MKLVNLFKYLKRKYNDFKYEHSEIVTLSDDELIRKYPDAEFIVMNTPEMSMKVMKIII